MGKGIRDEAERRLEHDQQDGGELLRRERLQGGDVLQSRVVDHDVDVEVEV